MNLDTKNERSSWRWIVLSSLLLAGGAGAVGRWVLLPPVLLLVALFLLGGLSGVLARRHGWFSGLMVGFTFSLTQLTWRAAAELGGWTVAITHPNYARVAIPAAVVAAGLSVLGGITGVWMRGTRRTEP